MPVHPRFREHADKICASMQEGSLVIQSHRILSLEDDGDPEGGVLVKARFNLGGDFTDWASAPNLVEWASRAIKSKLGYKQALYMVEETEDSMTVRFKCILRIRKDEFVTLARDIMEQKGIEDYAGRLKYDDEMVAINDDGRYMNVLRKANRNPTTCVLDAGYGECIRHHGEYSYLIKHLLKLSEGLSE